MTATLDAPPRHLDDDTLPLLALNVAAVPGGCGGVVVPAAPIVVLGVTWEPIDFSPWHSPIGAALAMETAGRGALAVLDEAGT